MDGETPGRRALHGYCAIARADDVVIPAFNYARLPPIYFGAGKLQLLPDVVRRLGGTRLLLVIGGKSLRASGKQQEVQGLLETGGLDVHTVTCDQEPTAAFIDGICGQYREVDM